LFYSMTVLPLVNVSTGGGSGSLRLVAGEQADSGAGTLIQRFGSAANLMVQPQYPRCASD
jgi:hypothetical protein